MGLLRLATPQKLGFPRFYTAKGIHVTFIEADGSVRKVVAKKDDTVLDCAHTHDVELEGACGGTLSCSTCHVVVKDDAFFDKIPPPQDEELDMLDLALGLEKNSRLGCQIILNQELDGVTLVIPGDSS